MMILQLFLFSNAFSAEKKLSLKDQFKAQYQQPIRKKREFLPKNPEDAKKEKERRNSVIAKQLRDKQKAYVEFLEKRHLEEQQNQQTLEEKLDVLTKKNISLTEQIKEYVSFLSESLLENQVDQVNSHEFTNSLDQNFNFSTVVSEATQPKFEDFNAQDLWNGIKPDEDELSMLLNNSTEIDFQNLVKNP